MSRGQGKRNQHHKSNGNGSRSRGRNSRNKQGKRAQQFEAKPNYKENELIRINKFIAHAGYCSRRDADTLVADGKVTINGETVTELGTKIRRSDTVKVEGQSLRLEPYVYILLNKSRDTISTTDDEKDRRTVLDQINDATGNRVYPVGRLDRNTTGLLLLTNDGDLANRLMHPSYEILKVYEVETKYTMNESDFEAFINGVELEDGPAKAHSIKQFIDDNRAFEIALHQGRNRQIRRMVEAVNNEVVRLKRIEYAGLTLKDVRNGRWRYLKSNEVNRLRNLVKLAPLNFNK